MSGGLRLYCWGAGAADGLTGLSLIAAPLAVLAAMGIVDPPAEPIYLRFIGAFVLGVGLAYLVPMAGAAERREARWREVFEVTALLRATVALFLVAAVASAALAAAWLLVAAFDGALAGFQIAVLRAGAHDERR